MGPLNFVLFSDIILFHDFSETSRDSHVLHVISEWGFCFDISCLFAEVFLIVTSFPHVVTLVLLIVRENRIAVVIVGVSLLCFYMLTASDLTLESKSIHVISSVFDDHTLIFDG
jgi:hypothetical protein